MADRRESRHAVRLPVRIFGTDAEGQVFSENVFSFDVSQKGARLDGVRTRLKIGDTIGIVYGQNKGRFCVKWAGRSGSPQAGQFGLVSIAPEKNIWDASLPAASPDTYSPRPRAVPENERRQNVSDRRQGDDRRQPRRLKCMTSVQITAAGQNAPIWGNAVDLSIGGCFVEMPIPLQKGTKLRMAIWINELKLMITGRVVSSRPGFGIGIQFIEMSDNDAEALNQFLKSITQIPM